LAKKAETLFKEVADSYPNSKKKESKRRRKKNRDSK
jgi:hypothetical protein